jgi:two-component system sensor histidine kinase CiaH
MFRSAALRLTLWYLAIVMAVSLVFSGLLYRVSANDLERNLNRQIGYFNNFLGPGDSDSYSLLRQRQLVQDRDHLRANLVLFNLLVLLSGGAASYWLARRTLEPIEKALESQSRFAADASHELRTPLTAIQTENEVALRNSGLTKDQAIGLLKSNLEEVAKLKALSEGLLRLANSGGVQELQAVALKEIVPEAINRFAKAAELKHIKIIDKTTDIKVRSQPDSLVELLAIFIDNAIKYSPPNRSIIISSRKNHRAAEIAISDKGKGIAAADLPRVFERFYQADTSRSKQSAGGYGLGLAIARKLVDAHGGHIEVKSTPAKGSTFIVHLPSA